MKTIKEKISVLLANKKVVYLLLILLGIILLSILICIVIDNNKKNNETITYNELKTMMERREDFLIYYYNSKSTNKNNLNIKKYLDEKGIRYFNYDDAKVDREEYNKLLELLKIEKELFGVPAIIYIKEGIMYSNLINIDSKEVVDKYIEDYDLFTVK